MNKRVGIITKIDANHGSCIFDRSLTTLFEKNLPGAQVETVVFPFCRTRPFELLRALKPNKYIPFFNLIRHRLLIQYSNRTIHKKVMAAFPTYEGITNQFEREGYDVLIPSKVLWDITPDIKTSPFPNFYWPSEELPAQKFAYAISGHRTDLSLFRQMREEVKTKLVPYKMIGVRDDMTQVMMEESGVDKIVPVTRITDPAFLFENGNVDLQALLRRLKIKQDKPIFGLLFYGKPQLAKQIVDHYHARGYQTVNFSMFNPYAEVNVGHLVDPDEWVALFKILSFCITDRFHGTVFCLREDVPFVSIEPFRPKTLLNSKIYSLVKEFDLVETCYRDSYDPLFSATELLDTCKNLEQNWARDFYEKVHSQVKFRNEEQRAFLRKICAQILA